MKLKINKQDALDYHEQGQPGKIEVVPTKLMNSQLDLALAYSPGVAEPCKEIANKKENVYKYTSKGNLVGVISNGTAVLGLGNIGPDASKPVMEGKGVLFKKFAGIDVFDIEVDATDPDEFIKVVKALEPTFGGINLEDIKAPESFKIEKELKEKLNIPVMHDDQHGTAIISAAALLNALEVVKKKVDKIKLVMNGAGAAAISCAKLYKSLGVKPENIIMCDSKGVIRADRGGLDEYKQEFATKKDVNTLHEAIKDADVFVGLSVANVLSADDLKKMAKHPIVFALANPNPEISYDLATEARKDVIMATGRSDHPNQVNNVLGFPYIFRGAMDVRATKINEEMKLAAVKAIANLAKEPVPEIVLKAYGDRTLRFGRDYLIPKPLDPRLIYTISPAVAKAAMESGTARKKITDWDAYESDLKSRIGTDQKIVSNAIARAKQNPKSVVFAEADHYKILKTAEIVASEGIAKPILLGHKEKIDEIVDQYKINLSGCTIIDPSDPKQRKRVDKYADIFYERRKRKGLTYKECRKQMLSRNYFGTMMLELGEADAFISGLTKDYATSLRPGLQIVGVADGYKKVCGMFVISSKKGDFFFADTTVQVDPTAEEMVEIIDLTSQGVRIFTQNEPRIAVLSYSNFGSSKGKVPEKARKAVALAKEKFPDLIIDGDIQANMAVNPDLQKDVYPFSDIANEGANTLIFPDLDSGNIAYKLLMELGGADVLGPILLGMRKPVHILQIGTSIREIVNMTAVAVMHAQMMTKSKK
ncbi:MAG: NADP-dependent malic enzyme [Cyclobacteriaceae bacterium]|nr:NADP-dependent malic enzyme [Cyclobacteriaceae bacterium]